MGARQSYLYIYLRDKEKTYDEEGYTVKPSMEVVDKCRNFEVVTYTIDYKGGNGVNFDIYIYDSKITPPSAYTFAYCSPGIETHVAKKVNVYYSILGPMFPLIISFVRDRDTHNCDIYRLNRDRWNWASKITEYSLGDNLKEILEEEFKKTFRNRTIEFDVGSKQTNDVLVYPRELDKKNYRVIFIPSTNDAVLNSNCLFTFETKIHRGSEPYEFQVGCKPSATGDKKIDPYFLDSIKNKKFYNGIIVYFLRPEEKNDISYDEEHDKNTPLLVEFIYLCETKFLKRKDKDGYWWSEEQVTYKDDKALQSELSKIDTESKGNVVNTVFLDMKKPYRGPTGVDQSTVKAYTKYTHKFGSAKQSIILFERTDPEIKGKTPKVNATNVEVYYLKAGSDEDTKPFLIVFDEKGDGTPMKAYYFKHDGEFKDWEEFDQLGKLPDKLEKIANSGACSGHLHWLRGLAYRILTTEDPPPETPPKPKEDPPRPKVLEREIEPDPPPLEWIITGSVGGVVFVGSSAVGYGVYWYNTTIRLLT
ncbi:hypothetical protein MACJ_000566 [Theileria orientalis]|uniref:Uncharacterized protein n=1 Tax=Theileria orientalis TaxID=68886 RepID=A0A976M4B5_THEOR|nr:hypothetical protein MACJ_000566 [Theileria orientalis]